MGAAETLLALPLLAPLLTALASLLSGDRLGVQKWVGVLGSAAHLTASAWLLGRVAMEGILVMHIGGWRAPFGVAFAADRLSSGMILLAALVGFLGMIYALRGLGDPRQLPRFLQMLQLMLTGCCGLFLTTDLFNFYVWFELILISSFGLMALGNRRAQMEATTKYLAMNIIGSMLLLVGIALLYSLTGTLNMAHLAVRLPDLGRPHMSTAVGTLLLLALGIKSAVFPLFFWLPASYHTPPIPVTAIFGGLLTKVGVYGLIRLFTLLFVQQPGYTHTLFLVIGGLTMITGVLGAVAQHELPRLLSFHIISQIGYMLMGLGFLTVAGLGGAIFFMFHIIITKNALFFVSGMVERMTGTYDLHRFGGLYGRGSATAVLFLLPALSLGGMPPFSGFAGKLLLIQAGMEAEQYLVVGTAILVSLLTLYSMVKIWTLGFWSPPPAPDPQERSGRHSASKALVFPTAVLVLMTVLMGVGAEPVVAFSRKAAEGLLDHRPYIEAVLGESPP